MSKILVVDDDPSFNKMLTLFLNRNEFEAIPVHSSRSALEALNQHTFDLVLTDFKLPDLNGLELIEHIKEGKAQLPIILMTNYRDIRTAVKSIQLGAFEFVTKPINPSELLLLVKNAIAFKNGKAESKIHSENTELKQANEGDYIIGKSKAARELWHHIGLVAPTKMSVLILGESGTGKEYAARLLHEKSSRKESPFYAIDCGALSRELAASELFGHVKGAFTGALSNKTGAFEKAHGGTLFLDEVGNLSYEVQVQLLRALQERKIRPVGSDEDIAVDLRIIAATNEGLKQAIDQQSFRLDLYHRLNEFSLHVPSLKVIKDDLRTFVDHFLIVSARELEREIPTLSEETFEVLKNYSWPGNLRELRNIIRRSVLLCQGDTITPKVLPEEICYEHIKQPESRPDNVSLTDHDLKSVLINTEKEMILNALGKTRYNKSKTATLLNIDRKTLYNKIKQYGIEL